MAADSRTNRGRVLVLGEGTRAFLGTVRSLGRRGLTVEAAGVPARSPEASSRYLSTAHDLGDLAHPERFADRLESLLRAKPFDLVVPVTDPHVLLLHNRRERFSRHAILALPPISALEASLDKIRSSEIAREVGLPVPPFAVSRDPADAREIAASLGLPVRVKPCCSFPSEQFGEKLSVRRALTLGDLERAISELAEHGPVQVQKPFFGRGVGVEILAADGEVLVAFEHARVHEPSGGGGSSYRTSVALDEAHLDAARRLVGRLCYSGVAMIELKEDPRTGEFAFIEINPRFWGSLPLALCAGVDFPYYLYEATVLGRRRFDPGYHVGVFARNLKSDLGWHARRATRGKEQADAPAPSLLDVMKSGSRLVLLEDHTDTFVADDPRPGFREIGAAARESVASMLAHGLTTSARLPAIRSVAQKRAERALRHAKTVLFVCKGNISRSPFAEHMAALVFGQDERFRSAGLIKQPGRRSPIAAKEAARRFGVDLSAHRSRILTQRMIEEADLLFVFDATTLRMLLVEHGSGLLTKTHLLGVFGDHLQIADPYGRPEPVFAETYRAIEAAMRRAYDSTRGDS